MLRERRRRGYNFSWDSHDASALEHINKCRTSTRKIFYHQNKKKNRKFTQYNQVDEEKWWKIPKSEEKQSLAQIVCEMKLSGMFL